MNLLNKLTVKNLKLNKKRTIVTIVGIMLSVALITAVASVYASGLQSIIEHETKNKGAFHVAFFNVPYDDISAFKSNRAIDSVNLISSLGYANIDSKNEYKPYLCIKEFSRESLDNLAVRLVSGRLPENGGEILIPTHLKTDGRVFLSTGDVLQLKVGERVDAGGKPLGQSVPLVQAPGSESPDESIINKELRTYKVVGIIERPSYNIEKYSAPGYTAITLMDESKQSGNTDVFVRFTKSGVKNAARHTAAILGADGELLEKAYNGSLTYDESVRFHEELENAKYECEYNSYLIGLETNPLNVSGIKTIEYVALVIIAIIVVTGVFCIKNSFDISITEKRRQYGMLRSVGATRRQVRKNVFFEATVLGLFGLPLGVLLGFAASYILIIVSNHLVADSFSYGFKLRFVFPWQAVVAAVLLGTVTVYFSAIRSAGRASGISPIDAIRGSREIKIDASKLSCPAIIRRIFGMGGELSYKNLKRNKRKYRTTVVSIVISVAVFISLSSFVSMAFEQVVLEVGQYEYNIAVYANYPDAGEYRKLIDTTEFDAVEDFSVIRTEEMQISGDRYSKEYSERLRLMHDSSSSTYISISCVGDKQFAGFCTSIGLDPREMNDKAILCDYTKVSEYGDYADRAVKYMRKFNYNAGETVSGSIENASTGSKTDLTVEIAAVSEQRPFGLNNREGVYLFVSDAFYDSVAETGSVSVVYKTDASDKLQNEIEAHLQDSSYRLTNRDESYRQNRNFLILISIFLYGFIIVISLIGITSIFNTITTNMELRRPEFAMLRSVGMTNREFNRMIRLESLFMGARSLLFGIPFGLLLSYLIYFLLAKESGIPFTVSPLALIISVSAVFVLISLIMAYSMSKIKKQNTIETIRNENI